MGRKPNPVIAANFTRGQKHGQTTNRYAQTCNHCSLLFPTGRPETLYAHLASCPGLTQEERAGMIGQIYNTSSTIGATQMGATVDQHHDFRGNDDFDITGLNVLAGVAENAEDMVIDPRIAVSEPSEHVANNDPSMLRFFDGQPESSFPQSTSTSNAWTYPFHSVRDSDSPYLELTSVADASPSFSIADLPGTQWSFAPIITPPTTYIAHPAHQAPVVFADSGDNDIDQELDSAEAATGILTSTTRARQGKEPYTESKRARVAEMRQVGACIRCSRLRKTCEPVRPCGACRGTASKTWIGGCTSLNKGQEFNVWFGHHLSQLHGAQMRTNAGNAKHHLDHQGQLAISYFGVDGPKLMFELSEVQASVDETEANADGDRSANKCLIIHKKEDVAQKLLHHAIDHQELIIDNVDAPALDATVRICQGLSIPQDGEMQSHAWGSCKQFDTRLGRIFQLWLVVTMCATGQSYPVIDIVDDSGEHTGMNALDESHAIILSQLDVALETIIHQQKDELRRFDANILYQSYRYLFNLAIGIVLILDTVEKYCCYMKRRDCPLINYSMMLEQAQTLADKYAYCVQNIQMMPRFGFDTSGTMFIGANNGKVDYDMQQVWMTDLCMSELDLERYSTGDGDVDWVKPSGRLWSRVFKQLRMR